MREIRLLAAMAVLQLAGCAGMSQSECQLSDWRAVGYEDGSQGRAAEDFGKYRKRCAEHGVAPDFQAYQAGREAGLKEYCQEARGFQEGSQGSSYAGVCPADSEPRFLEGYNEGRTLYDLESSLRYTNRQIRDDETRIKQIEIELTDNMTAAIADVTTREERARLLVETRQLAEERSTLASEIKDLQAKRRTLEEQLAAARAELVTQR